MHVVLSGDSTQAIGVRQRIVNDLVQYHQSTMIGLSSIDRIIENEYGSNTLNLDDPASIAQFRIDYRNGKYQAECMQMLYFAQCDDCEFLVCSVVEAT